MTPPRFQFTIRGLLWATFWAAVACAATCYPQGIGYWNPTAPDALMVSTPMITGILVLVALCAAVGALVGQQRKGILVGLIATGGAVFWHLACLLIYKIHV